MPYRLPLERRSSNSPVPLTAVQKAYWQAIAKLPESRSPFRNPAASLRLIGPLDIPHLRTSVQAVAARHESLRARIEHFCLDRDPTQIIDCAAHAQLSVVDLSHVRESDREDAARRLGREFLSEGVDLRQGPAFDTALFQLSANDHVLVLVLDHIFADATSYAILTKEVMSALTSDPDVALTTALRPSLQFPDYAVWHRNTNASWLEAHEPYWRQKLSHAPRVSIPTDLHSSNGMPTSTSVLYVPFGKQLTEGLRETARREGCLLPFIILSLFFLTMSVWCRRSDLVVNFISHGRHDHPDLKGMIGCLAHAVPLRVEISYKEHLRDLLARVISEIHSSFVHDASRLSTVDVDRTDIYFNWLPGDWGLSGTHTSALPKTEDSKSSLRVMGFPIEKDALEKFTPYFSDTPSGILGIFCYGSDLLLRPTIERFAASLRRLLEVFVHEPTSAVASLDLEI